MSIPKEPRQLMINLMYLVLTAMLALNVSAEIINAFFRIDNGIVNTNKLLSSANDKSVQSMQTLIEKKQNYKPLLDAANQVTGIVKDFNSYIDGVRSEIEKEAGGLVPIDHPDKTRAGLPVRYKDKEIPQRYFVEGTKKAKPKGPEMKAKINETREKLIAVLENLNKLDIQGVQRDQLAKEIEQIKNEMPLKVDDDSWKWYKKKSWEQLYFGYMPVAAVYPILSKFQNDAKNTESQIINTLASKIGATTIEFDKFVPMLNAEKSYVISGEMYQATVAVGAFSSQAREGISIRVNGANLPLKPDGTAEYKVKTDATGEKDVKVDITIRNPLTGEIESASKVYKYEVGRRSVAVSADKMNVFYIGVVNPVSVSAAGVSSNQLKVTATGCNINNVGVGKFEVTASKPGDAIISVSGGGMSGSEFKFRVKRIPDPVARVGGKSSGSMGNGEMKAQLGVGAFLDNFDFDAKCNIVGFKLTRQAKRQDPVTITNSGARFGDDAQRLVNQASPSDTYYFDDVRAKCPGDEVGRSINPIVINIK